jgi:hypothetical protein
MESIFGRGVGGWEYVLVLLFYGALFMLIRQSHTTVELNFRRTYLVLYVGWAVLVFIGNYLFVLIGIMSFLPWLNNFIHTFLWIGLCLGFLYSGVYASPVLEQCLLFAIYSFLVKWAEHAMLGTWELDHFFFISGNMAYIIGWSVLDGLYPIISRAGLGLVSRFVEGVVVPQ